MKKGFLNTIGLIILFLTFLPFIYASDFEGKVIQEVRFQGLNKAEADRLKNSLFLVENMKFKDEEAARDMKNLYEYGYFDNIQLDIEQIKEGKLVLTYIVSEKPWIESIEISGNDELNDDEVLGAISNREKSFYNPFSLDEDTKKIVEEYIKQGYVGTQVSFTTEPAEEKNEIILKINIREGQEIYIKKIKVEGTVRLNPDDLKDSMENTSEPMVLGLKDYPLSQSDFQADLEKLTQFAKNQGFKNFQITKNIIQVKVAFENFFDRLFSDLEDLEAVDVELEKLKKDMLAPMLKKDFKAARNLLAIYTAKLKPRLEDKEDEEELIETKKWAANQLTLFENLESILKIRLESAGTRVEVQFVPDEEEAGYYLTIQVDEDSRYLFQGAAVRGNEKISTEEIKAGLDLEPGDVYNDEKFTNFLRNTYINYQSDGFFYAKITPIPDVNEEKKAVGYLMDIYEGDKVHIENMYILGNTKTEPMVIDRELRLKEGEIYDLSKILRSRERLMKSQYFSNVLFEPKAGSEEGLIDIYWKVEEAKTGMLTLGGGYGTLSGFTLFGQVSELNLFGSGYNVSLRGDYGQKRQAISASFGSNWIGYMPIRYSFSVGYSWSQLDMIPKYDRDGNGVWDKYYEGGLHNEGASGFDENVDEDRNGDGVITSEDDLGAERYVKKESVNLGFGLGYSFSEYWSIGGSQGVFFSKYYDPHNITVANLYEDDEYRLKTLLQDNDYSVTTKTGVGVTYDSSNHPLTPTKGFKFSPAVTFYGLQGGYSQFTQLETELAGYVNLSKLMKINTKRTNWNLVWANYLSLTTITALPTKGDPQLYSEYRLGFDGMRELRGWGDYVYEDELKGLGKVSFSSELRIPIPGTQNMLWWAFFFDAGNVSPDPFSLPTDFSEYRFSDGFGLKIEIPMFPIRLYFAERRVWEDGTLKSKGGLNFVLSISGFF